VTRLPFDPGRFTVAQREWADSSEVHGPRLTPDEAESVRLIALGAAPLSAALCRACRAIGWTPFVADPRERFMGVERFPEAEQVLIGWPAEVFAALGGLDERTAVVALAHAPELDDEAISLALRSPAFYVGAIGSRRTQAERHERLRRAGLGEQELQRLSGPAGLDLGGRSAGEAALAILAEAVAVRHGRDGGRLRASVQAIHVEPRP
jgi:xanthine dehydrogenase accessory factor